MQRKHKIQPKPRDLPLADTKEMNGHGCVSRRTNERLYRYEQLPPAGQATQPEGQGAAVADALAAGRLGLHAGRPLLHQPRKQGCHPHRDPRVGAGRLHTPPPDHRQRRKVRGQRVHDLRTTAGTVAGRTVIGKTVVGKSDNGKTDAGKSHTTKYRETKYRSIKYRFDSFPGIGGQAPGSEANRRKFGRADGGIPGSNP